MKKIVFLISGTFLIVWFSSCEDIISKDISKSSITLLAPQNGDTSTNYSQTFWWQEIKGAQEYKLQIAKPSFSNLSQFVLDTNITTDRFIFTLQPGHYEWRVRATNNISKTAFVTYTLDIDTTYDLSNQKVVLVSPTPNLFTNQTNINFQWNAMFSAENYRIQITNYSNNALVVDDTTVYTSFNKSLGAGTYQWQVRAQNNFGPSLFSDSRVFTIDFTAPIVSTLLTPADGATLPNPVDLKWSRSSGAEGDSIYIYADSLYTTVLVQDFTTNQSFTFSSGVTGTSYYWRLKTTDVAGNWSGFSTRRHFIIQ